VETSARGEVCSLGDSHRRFRHWLLWTLRCIRWLRALETQSVSYVNWASNKIHTEDVVMCQVPVSVIDARAACNANDNAKTKHGNERDALADRDLHTVKIFGWP
jgi:hypothetical protein